MATLDSLTDGQRAVLQLLLKQGKSYDDIAGAAEDRRRAPCARAHEARRRARPRRRPAIGDDRRDEIADYLLGQQTASRRAATREYLEDSAAGPRLGARGRRRAAPAGRRRRCPRSPPSAAEVDEAFDALDARTARQERGQARARSSADDPLRRRRRPGRRDRADPRARRLRRRRRRRSATTATVARTGEHDAERDRRRSIAAGRAGARRARRTPTATAESAIVRYPADQPVQAAGRRQAAADRARGPAYGDLAVHSAARTRCSSASRRRPSATRASSSVVADLSPDTRNYREVLVTRERVEKPATPGTIVLRGRLRIADRGGGHAATTDDAADDDPLSAGTYSAS